MHENIVKKSQDLDKNKNGGKIQGAVESCKLIKT